MSEMSSKYEIRSQEVQELLGQVPRWIIRWGTILVFIIMLILFLFSKVLRYPDIIISQVKLTANIPPAELKAKINGQIVKVFVADEQKVDKGQVLAVIQSAADYNDVLWLDDFILDTFLIEQFLESELTTRNLSLGELQTSFAAFIYTLEEYMNFVNVDYYIRKMKSLQEELEKYNKYIGDLSEQQSIIAEELGIIQGQYERDSGLYIQGVISKSDLEKVKEKKLAKLFEIKESKTRLSQTNIEISALTHDILELELQLEKQNKNLYNSLKSKWAELRGEIAQWRNLYVIESTIEGEVTFTRIWSENQYVSEGDIVMIVLPVDLKEIIGHLYLKPSGTGKVKVGNKVMIKFDNYPYLEYGVVTGRVESMSRATENDLYYARVALDSTNLITNYNYLLTFNQNMQGSAEIITDSRSLYNRIFAPLKSAMQIQHMYKDE